MTTILNLPGDVLVEILCYLPALSILLCRRTCQKLNQLSRERYLWIQLFNQTQDMLRPAIDVGQKGAFEIERTIAQAEVLERIWTNPEELWIAPRYWRRTSHLPEGGLPEAIMGEYIIFLSYDPKAYIWISVHDTDKTIFLECAISDKCTSYLDPTEKTFFVISSLEETSLKITGIQVDIGGPHVAIEYFVSLREHAKVDSLAVNNGLVWVKHDRHENTPDQFNFDILDLERRTLFQFAWTYALALSIVPPGVLPYTQSLHYFATAAHIIFVTSRGSFAVLNRPSQRDQQPNPAPLVKLFEPALKGHFPAAFFARRDQCIIPRSTSSFAVVGFERVGAHWLEQPSQVNIRLLYINISNQRTPMTEVCSLSIPGELRSSVLPTPSLSAQYALGALSIMQRITDGPSEDGEGHKYYTLRIDLSNLDQEGLAGPSLNRITANRMYLTPAVDVEEEEAIFCGFDPFSGKVIMSVSPSSSVLVLDYLNVD